MGGFFYMIESLPESDDRRYVVFSRSDEYVRQGSAVFCDDPPYPREEYIYLGSRILDADDLVIYSTMLKI